jgi:hypothetical protein
MHPPWVRVTHRLCKCKVRSLGWRLRPPPPPPLPPHLLLPAATPLADMPADLCRCLRAARRRVRRWQHARPLARTYSGWPQVRRDLRTRCAGCGRCWQGTSAMADAAPLQYQHSHSLCWHQCLEQSTQPALSAALGAGWAWRAGKCSSSLAKPCVARYARCTAGIAAAEPQHGQEGVYALPR